MRTCADVVGSDSCRLCGAATQQSFVLRVLEKFDVSYRECGECESLQTEPAFWLPETYSGSLPNLDVGGARRNVRSCSIVLLTTTILRISRNSRLLDFGGGDGFVARILRDLGFAAVVYDKYAKNTYADGFIGAPDQKYEVISAFEVWEHLAQPREEIDLLFSKRPDLVIVSTDLYRHYGSDWAYLGSGHGGHVFFYSEKAMRLLAAKFGYCVLIQDTTTVFSRHKLTSSQRLILSAALKPVGLLAGRLWLQLIKPKRSKAA